MDSSIEYITLDESVEYIMIEDSFDNLHNQSAVSRLNNHASQKLTELMELNPINNMRMLCHLPIRNEDGYTLNYSHYGQQEAESMDSSSIESTTGLPAFQSTLNETPELHVLELDYDSNNETVEWESSDEDHPVSYSDESTFTAEPDYIIIDDNVEEEIIPCCQNLCVININFQHSNRLPVVINIT